MASTTSAYGTRPFWMKSENPTLLLASGGSFFWTEGGWEYPVLWTIIALMFVVRGGGQYSLDRLIGREI